MFILHGRPTPNTYTYLKQRHEARGCGPEPLSMLTTRLFTILLLLVTCLVAITAATRAWVVLPPLYKLEREADVREIRRVDHILEDARQKLRTLSSDYAEWVDTVTFMQQRNSTYLENNYYPAAMANLGINLILFRDQQGSTIHCNLANLTPPQREQLQHVCAPDSLTPNTPSTKKEDFQILKTPQGPLLLHSHDIIAPDAPTVRFGTLTVGQLITPEHFQQLAYNVGSHATLSVPDHAAPASTPTATDSIDNYTLRNAAGQITHHWLSPDGDAVARIDITPPPRQFTAKLLDRSIIQGGLYGTAFALSFTLIFFRLVIFPIQSMASHMRQIAQTGRYDTRLELPLTGELHQLQDHYNALLHTVQQQQRALIQANEALATLTETDALTDTLNRRGYQQRLETCWPIACREQQPLSLILCDVDHFKAYNDHYGHAQGDEALRAIANALGGQLHRATDALARIGGEEFAILLPNTDQSAAVKIAKRLQSAIERLALPHATATTAPHITASLGVASITPEARARPEQLFNAADQALYAAKAAGRNQVQQAPIMTTSSQSQRRA